MPAEPLDDFDAGILELTQTYDAAAALPRGDDIAARAPRRPDQENIDAE
ncbi:hypothetical protein [Sphingomonas sp. PAMC 26605]|nr:hypothetical protein [Sphingomonas sp. PAMC 26605]